MSMWWDEFGKMTIGIILIAGVIWFGIWRLREARERDAKELVGCTVVASQGEFVIYECPGGKKLVR